MNALPPAVDVKSKCQSDEDGGDATFLIDELVSTFYYYNENETPSSIIESRVGGPLSPTISTCSSNSSLTGEVVKEESLYRKRRIAANARERKRMNRLNDAFERLRKILARRNQTSQRKITKPISKIEALVMAQSYIMELNQLLQES